PTAPPAAAPSATKPAEPPKPPPDFRKESPPNTRIFVVGCEDFAVENVPENLLLMQSVVDYMSNEDLGSLRAKRLEIRSFEEPDDWKKTLAKVIGWAGAPVILLILGIWVQFWRRVIQPARMRRAMAETQAA